MHLTFKISINGNTIMDGNKKKIKTVSPLKSPVIPIGELTILAELVVAVIESKIPADVAAIKTEINAKIPR